MDFAQLDSQEYVVRLDPKGMYDLTVAFPDQVESAVSIAQAAPPISLDRKPSLALLTGLGGSAAGGDFVRALFESEAKIPFLVNRDYNLPSFVDDHTVVIACSYSGNTEETLSAYNDAKAAGAMIICVTSGGKLADRAKADGIPVILIPGGQPPRTSLGFLLLPVVCICESLGLISAQNYGALVAHLRACVKKWSVQVPLADNEAKSLATTLYGRLSVIYGLGGWQALVANRWKGQINENAKNMTFANAFPELNHNEILGWVKANEQGVSHWVGVVLEDGTESAKMQKRREITERLTAAVCEWHSVKAEGNTLLEKMLSLALHGDFVSLYLAALNGVDPENIDSINVLKAELANVP